MKHWIVRDENGASRVISTSGDQPPNAIAKLDQKQIVEYEEKLRAKLPQPPRIKHDTTHFKWKWAAVAFAFLALWVSSIAYIILK